MKSSLVALINFGGDSILEVGVVLSWGCKTQQNDVFIFWGSCGSSVQGDLGPSDCFDSGFILHPARGCAFKCDLQ